MSTIPENGPREVRPTRSWKTLQLGLRVSLGLILAVMASFMVRNDANLRRLRDRGQMIDGHVLSKEIRRSRNTYYRITYNFEVADKWYEDTAIVDPEAYARVSEGDVVPVTFDPQDPSLFRYGKVDDALIGSTRLWWILKTILLGIVMEAVTLYFESEAKKQREALSSFPAVFATIVKLDPESPTSRGTTATVSFDRGYGIEETTKIWLQRHYSDIKTGKTVTLFLNEERPPKSILLPSATFFEVVSISCELTGRT